MATPTFATGCRTDCSDLITTPAMTGDDTVVDRPVASFAQRSGLGGGRRLLGRGVRVRTVERRSPLPVPAAPAGSAGGHRRRPRRRRTGQFDEGNLGLDHLALAVGDTAILRQWQAELNKRKIINSGIVESDAGHQLNLRGPDSLPIELFVLNDETAEGLGLRDAPFAMSHR